MTRISKQAERRAKCPKKRRASFAEKTGPKEDLLPEGYKIRENAVTSKKCFIPKVK